MQAAAAATDAPLILDFAPAPQLNYPPQPLNFPQEISVSSIVLGLFVFMVSSLHGDYGEKG